MSDNRELPLQKNLIAFINKTNSQFSEKMQHCANVPLKVVENIQQISYGITYSEFVILQKKKYIYFVMNVSIMDVKNYLIINGSLIRRDSCPTSTHLVYARASLHTKSKMVVAKKKNREIHINPPPLTTEIPPGIRREKIPRVRVEFGVL